MTDNQPKFIDEEEVDKIKKELEFIKKNKIRVITGGPALEPRLLLEKIN